ncbi:alpha/beta hydrolase [Sphingopyxis sp.]|uniref:alpha/beta hydrolase n=1 Tax=Sphingopyxis sp. TaxID=1908224 RepID=UPI003D1442FE
MIRSLLFAAFASIVLASCTDAANGQSAPSAKSAFQAQRGEGLPYEVSDTEVWDVPDPVSARDYQVFVALPPSYRDQPQRRYPVLYVTDADYAFPVIKQIGRRLNVERPTVEEYILVGLSYAKGEGGMQSRRRDYTPTPNGPSTAPADAEHGKAAAYAAYVRDQVLPFVAGRYRTDERRRLFLGHSYGALLGAEILLSEPRLFDGYILGSPSFWYDHHHMAEREKAYAAKHKDLSARVYMYIGEYEEMRPGDPRYAKDVNMVTDTRAMDRALRSRNYPSLRMEVEVLNDEDHFTVAPRGFTRGLKYLLPAKAP